MNTCQFVDPDTGQKCGGLTAGTPMCQAHINYVQAHFRVSGTRSGRSSAKDINVSVAQKVQTIELTAKSWKVRLIVVSFFGACSLLALIAGLINQNIAWVGVASVALMCCLVYRLYVSFMIWWNHK